jgi:ubiquinone/menaquinone biosynthesis C-methylase UbiE
LGVVNYFAHSTAAERYARDRPRFHSLVIERIRAFLKLASPVSVALDVGCGTGHSTLALTEIAESIIATDISPAMLARAPAHPRIRYLQAPAEHLPVGTRSVDLITVTLAFHWFDRPRFLAEVRRVLREDGTLVISSHRFHFRMLENPEINQWFEDHYFPKYPTPPRNNDPLTDEAAQESGLRFAGRDRYTHELTMSPDQLARNLVTHSNVIAAVEQGNQSLEDVYQWLVESVTPFFPAATGTFVFGGEIWYLQLSE